MRPPHLAAKTPHVKPHSELPPAWNSPAQTGQSSQDRTMTALTTLLHSVLNRHACKAPRCL